MNVNESFLQGTKGVSGIAPFAALALLATLISVPYVAQADEFKSEPGPPTLSPIVLSENDNQSFTAIQPAFSSSADRYNVQTSIGLPGGHDDLVGLEMCWYLFDFADCSDSSKLAASPETVFKATHSVIRSGDSSTEITGDSFSIVGDNNYVIKVGDGESSTSADREEDGSVNVDVQFTFEASNAMRSSNNWKVYVEAEDRQGNTGATSRDGIRVNYFAEMTTFRQDVNFAGVKKGQASVVNGIDTGNYSANAQSQFFIKATDFVSTGVPDLPIRTSAPLAANQVEIRCSRDASFDTNTAMLVKKANSSFGSTLSPTGETPVDASDHSCSVRTKGRLLNPNLLYSNTFTLSIAAADVNAPTNLSVSGSVTDATTQRQLSFDPPQPVASGAATLESYRIQVVDTGTNATEQTVRVTLAELQNGSDSRFTFTDATSQVSAVFSNLSPGTSYEFVVEANTSIGFGSTTSASSSTDTPALYDFTTATFTSGGQTGRSGPSLTQLRSGVGNPSWASTYLQQGAYTGQILWTVPEDGTYRIETFGAQGGGTSQGGARMRGDFTLSQGEKLRMVVGQPGDVKSQVYTGGGGTFVAKENYTPLIVAAGSGGRGSAGSASIGSDQAGTGCAGGAGFSDNGPFSNTGASPQSFKNGAKGGLSRDVPGSEVAGGFGGGGGGDYDGSFSGNDNGGGGGYQGGAGACNRAASGGFSYNDGTNQSNTTGGNSNASGRIIISKQ